MSKTAVFLHVLGLGLCWEFLGLQNEMQDLLFQWTEERLFVFDADHPGPTAQSTFHDFRSPPGATWVDRSVRNREISCLLLQTFFVESYTTFATNFQKLFLIFAARCLRESHTGFMKKPVRKLSGARSEDGKLTR